MKKITYSILGLLLGINHCSVAQVSTGFNTGIGTDFVGWNTTMNTIPLNIKHENPLAINFYTNAGNAAFNNMRMQIFDGGGNPFNAGFVGIGNFTTFSPQARLHQHVAGFNTNFHQFTNGATGPIAPFSGFRIGINQGGIAELRQWSALPMDFYTNDNVGFWQRMRITFGIGNNNNVATNDVTKVSINYGRAVNPIVVPVAMLNLGSKTFQGEGRRWMDVGTFGSIGSDDCYFGLKSEGPERTDAVIAWGDDYDNFFAPSSQTKYLRFIFACMNQKNITFETPSIILMG